MQALTYSVHLLQLLFGPHQLILQFDDDFHSLLWGFQLFLQNASRLNQNGIVFT